MCHPSFYLYIFSSVSSILHSIALNFWLLMNVVRVFFSISFLFPVMSYEHNSCTIGRSSFFFVHRCFTIFFNMCHFFHRWLFTVFFNMLFFVICHFFCPVLYTVTYIFFSLSLFVVVFSLFVVVCFFSLFFTTYEHGSCTVVRLGARHFFFKLKNTL